MEIKHLSSMWFLYILGEGGGPYFQRFGGKCMSECKYRLQKCQCATTTL